MKPIAPLAISIPVVLLAVACLSAALPIGTAQTAIPAELGKKAILPPQKPEAAPPASPRQTAPGGETLPKLISSYFDNHIGRRLYLQVDKPVYQPGETIWFKVWDLQARALNPANNPQSMVELISPKGATVLKHRLAGNANNAFDLPPGAQGGEYTLRATSHDGKQTERAVIVSVYEPPRLKKKLEFVKKAYGAGDQVTATVEIKRPTGEALGGKGLSAVINLDGVELPRVKVTSNAQGEALVKFDLPNTILVGDGLLTILVEDGGITESISKSIPIVLKKMALSFFPEGGKMVSGLPSRLYFEANTPLGKPADVEGRLVDDLGNAVANFSSVKNGLGRLDFTPATGRHYHAEITRPLGISEKYALAMPEREGCVLRSFDDFDGQAAALRVAVRCTEKQQVIVAATVRENLLDVARVQVDGDKPAVIYLANSPTARAAGIARVTVFDQHLQPLAERLVFRNRRARLNVTVAPDKKAYGPRGQVALLVSTSDASGKPVAAELAMSVVDDTVISFADDKSGHLLSKLLFEPELPGKIQEPNFYLDLTEAKSAMALDLLMGTRGYRRFEWVPVTRPPQSIAFAKPDNPVMPPAVEAPMPEPVRAPVPMQAQMRAPAAPPPPPKLAAAPAPIVMAPQKPVMVPNIIAKADRQREAKPEAQGFARPAAEINEYKNEDKDFARAAGAVATKAKREEQGFAAVRVFPIPAFTPDYNGPRTDYRETVFWDPALKTDQNGKATVRFVLSDAVTSFRAFTEGVGAGLAGRDESVFKSSLPFSLSVKLPLEVSAGDKPLIPITLSNDSENSLDVNLNVNFGAQIRLSEPGKVPGALGKLNPGQRKSWFIPLDVSGTRGLSEVSLAATSAGLKDGVVRGIPVAPVGFPQLIEKSGQIKDSASHELDLRRATPGSVQASVKVYTSALSTMISGLDGMLREPSGCFEQTSSTNYPNVMIMQYMKQHDVADSALLERSGKLLDNGYKKLAGFEAPKKGYEWFGGDPGHEALTAYGLLEFADMKDIYGAVDPAMLARTADWLKSRRDGKGGYLRDAKALDTFGRASADVTDAYITWALVSAGQTGLALEIAKSAKLAQSTEDAYQMALATGTLLQTPSQAAAAKSAAAKLAKMQSSSGAWTNAEHSITRSGGSNLHIETTSLAILALLKADGYQEPVRKGIAWLQNNRSGFGQWGATQATVLALKAIIANDAANRIAPGAGTVALLIDGALVREVKYQAGQRDAIVFGDFDDKLTPGKHTLTLKSSSGSALPYSFAIEYRSAEPASSAAAVVDLRATLAKTDLKMGDAVRLDAVISNKTQSGQPMTLARIGLPGGLSFQNWQLKELREKGHIAFFETRAREVILYFRDLKPGEVKKIPIDLVANVPGTYTGPASSAYLYYNDTDKSWAAPLKVRIAP